MFGWFKNFRKEQEVEVPVPAVLISQGEHSKPKKPRKPKVKKEKVAVPKIEPKVDVLKFEFDPQNPRLGSIELDWNEEFVALLMKHGYTGKTSEDIVDSWLNDVCRNIVENQYPGANVPPPSPSTLVTRKKISEGKTEIS